jgi:biopolymer transport protein TolQ
MLMFAAANPFLEAYSQSDLFGKLIFIGLYILSICSWVILIHKVWLTYQAKRSSLRFQEAFRFQKQNPLSLDCDNLSRKNEVNPFLSLYQVLKKQSCDLISKNRHFLGIQPDKKEPVYLSLNDIDFVASHLSTTAADQIKNLEKNLYILSITVSLAPFLGLLGTVWGILMTFSELQVQGGGGGHQMVLGGLSMALATTVLGLLDAIPALIGYNYLKNSISSFSTDMEGFSNEILASVELQYRKVDAQ